MLLAKLCNKVSTRLFSVVLVAIFFVASSFDVSAQDRNKLEKQKAKLEKEI